MTQTARVRALATSIATRLCSSGKALACAGVAALLVGTSVNSASAASITLQTNLWTGGSDFNDSDSPVFTLLPYASTISFSVDGEYAHSHGGVVLVGVQVFDAKKNQWVTIQTVTLDNGNQFEYSGLLVPFLPTGITQVRLFSDPGQNSTFHNWGSASVTINEALINPQGSTFTDSGVLGNSLINLGTLNPGHTVPLTVEEFVQGSTGELILQLSSKKHFTIINSTDLALLGGTLTTRTVDGFKPMGGDKFTFLTTKNGLLGAFDKVTPTGTILGIELIQDTKTVTLEFTQGSFEDFATHQRLTPNQYSVAEALDHEYLHGKSENLIRYMDNELLRDLPHDFDLLAAEELTSVYAISMAYAHQQALNLQRRTDDIRNGSNGFSAAGLAINGNGPSYSGGFRTGVAGPTGNELRGDGKEVKETKGVVPAENRWGVFLSGTGEWVSVGDTNNARGYDLASGGFTLGVDYKVTPNFAIGLAAGYTGTTADLTDRGRVWMNGGKLGLYATYYQNQPAEVPTMSKDSSKDSSKEAPAVAPAVAKGFYVDVAAFGGYNSYDTRRGAIQGEARGDSDGGEVDALFGIGYDIKKGNLTFGPTASFNYTYVGTSGFTEHGSLAPLDIRGGKAESLRTAIGFKASYDWRVGSVLIKPEIRAAWQHEFGDRTYDLTSSFAGGTGDTFLVSGPRIGRDSALLGAGFAVELNSRCSTYVYYDGELGRTDYHSASVTGGFRVSF